jgi:hypothetical protein
LLPSEAFPIAITATNKKSAAELTECVFIKHALMQRCSFKQIARGLHRHIPTISQEVHAPIYFKQTSPSAVTPAIITIAAFTVPAAVIP